MPQKYVQWAYINDAEVPFFSQEVDKVTLVSRWSFWNVINAEVMKQGPINPVRVDRHALQVFYSRTKGGVDSASRFT